MNTSDPPAVLRIAAITLLCTASESVEQNPLIPFENAVLGSYAKMASEKRCDGWMAKCPDRDDCCETFHCTRFNARGN
uniref:U14-theraphotoxin-Cg1c n=1 Tax=Chilobrachys guangxiensis TaxID=278060 RepID=JZT23_CHIGU|nr:RecName: Full=U14-theraphotoxin-Cg1c; Short=U14-TRTX-Cg1c; AltName: Full=Jingzhaotoxin-23; Short=JZTX-23; Flags: Precursor [Chilobrachys guangxiensis]ABY71699.1 cystine knot toxin [Chilobrachys guangxiensis]